MTARGSTVAEEVNAIALAAVYATYEGADDVFAPDALLDVNAPTWRFQVQGPEAFVSWLKGHSPNGCIRDRVRVRGQGGGRVPPRREGPVLPQPHPLLAGRQADQRGRLLLHW